MSLAKLLDATNSHSEPEDNHADISLGTNLIEPGSIGGGSGGGSGVVGSVNSCDVEVYIDAKELAPHRDKPWFEGYLSERHRVPPSSRNLSMSATKAAHVSSRVRVSPDTFRQHGLLSGSTGGGKTRLSLHVLTELMRQGCSVVAIDPKEETLGHLAHCARMAGLAEDQITVLLPGQHGVGCPGWNPLDYRASGVAAYEAVAEFVKLVEASSPSWGARMADVLKNAARLAAYHNLSLVELVALLRDDAYREGLLRTDPPEEAVSGYGDRIAYSETRDYFLGEFASWSASRRAEAIDPVLNKVRALLDIPFLRSLLCARECNLDLGSLWSEDPRRQRVILVHLDFRALGGDGALLLAGLMSYHLFQTAMRVGTHSARSVVLYLDELGIQERFVGSAIRDILAMARSFNLRLLVACQHLGQLSPELRQALLTVAFRAFFRLGPEDARAATAFLAVARTGESVSRVALELPRRGKYDPLEMAQQAHLVMDTQGREIHVPPLVWAEFERFQETIAENSESSASRAAKIGAVRMLLSRVPRVYVRSAADRDPYEVGAYIGSLAGEDFAFTGPSPLRLIVQFPKPKVTVLERVSESDRQQAWCASLMALKEREAAIVTPELGTRLVHVLRVDLPAEPVNWQPYLSYGQSAELIEATWFWRRERIRAIRESANSDKEARESGENSEADADASDTRRHETSQKPPRMPTREKKPAKVRKQPVDHRAAQPAGVETVSEGRPHEQARVKSERRKNSANVAGAAAAAPKMPDIPNPFDRLPTSPGATPIEVFERRPLSSEPEAADDGSL